MGRGGTTRFLARFRQRGGCPTASWDRIGLKEWLRSMSYPFSLPYRQADGNFHLYSPLPMFGEGSGVGFLLAHSACFPGSAKKTTIAMHSASAASTLISATATAVPYITGP